MSGYKTTLSRSPTSGLARSVFMTRSTVILFSFYFVYTKSICQICNTFFNLKKLFRLEKKLILQ